MIRALYRERLAVVSLAGVIFALVIALAFLTPPLFLAFVKERTEINRSDIVKKAVLLRNTGALEETIRTTNENTALLLSVAHDTPSPALLLAAILGEKADGIMLSGILYDQNNDSGARVIIKGSAATREALRSFSDHLKRVKEFSHIELPVESFKATRDLSFTMTLSAAGKGTPKNN